MSKDINKIFVSYYSVNIREFNKYTDELIVFLSRLFVGLNYKKWEWEYKQAPGESIVKIAVLDGKIIGHYALIMIPMLVNGEVIVGAKAEGSLVDIKSLISLDKADRNVFGNLVQKCLHDISAYGQAAVFGFPNNKALPSQLKHGYQHVSMAGYELTCIRNPMFWLGKINIMLKPMFFLVSIVYCLLFDWVSRILYSELGNIRVLTEADSDSLNSFAKKMSINNHNVLMMYRSYDYYKWRIIDNPYTSGSVLVSFNDNGEIVGVLAYVIEDVGGISYLKVEDFVVAEVYVNKLLLAELMKIMRQNKLSYFTYWNLGSLLQTKIDKKKLFPLLCVKKKIKKNMIFYSNFFKYSSLDAFDVSLIYKRY